MVDKYNHIIEKGINYLKCQYFQKEKESKRKVQYKLLHDDVFVHPTQIMNPLVNLMTVAFHQSLYSEFSNIFCHLFIKCFLHELFVQYV